MPAVRYSRFCSPGIVLVSRRTSALGAVVNDAADNVLEERRGERLARAGGGRGERREATGRAGERDRHRAHLDGLPELARARVTHLLEEALERERRRGRGERGVAVRHDVPRRVVERRASGCEGRRTFFLELTLLFSRRFDFEYLTT